MSETGTKGYDTNPLDRRVAERAEAEMAEPSFESEAPTREMPPELRPIAGGPTQEIPGTAPGRPADTGHVHPPISGPIPQPGTAGMYAPPSQPYAPPSQPYAPQYAQQPNPFAGPTPMHGVSTPTAAPVRPSTDPLTGFRREGSVALGLKPNFAALAAYTPFVGGVIALLLVIFEPPRNRFVRFHAKQALIGHVVFWVLVKALSLGISNAPGPVSILLMFPQMALFVGYMVGFILMMSKAYNSERFKIPIIGDQAD